MMSTGVGEGTQRAVISSHQQDGRVAHLVGALHPGLSQFITSTYALPATEKVLLLPGKHLIGGVRRNREHAAIAKGS